MTTKIVTEIVAWFKFPEGKPVMKALRPGETLSLLREPSNQFNKNAIRVIGHPRADTKKEFANSNGGIELSDNITLGYIPAPIAARITNMAIIGAVKTGVKHNEITIEIG